jgi:HTH-type transcriptional regulator, sugar sensing transcriptional regulator
MELSDILSEYGLSKKESEVYLALLELGPSPARSVARRAGVNRGTAYDVVKKLVDLGLATYYRKGKQHFAAEPPERLVDAIEEKQSKLQKLKVGITDKLPELKVLYQQQGGKPAIRVYEGTKGIKKILADVLATVSESDKKEYYVYSSATAKERQSIYKDFPEFNQKRIAAGIKVQTIALGEGGETAGLDERKQIGSNSKKSSATHEIIYAGKVAHIGLDNSGNPVGVIIENTGIYQTQKTIFESLWSKLKS